MAVIDVVAGVLVLIYAFRALRRPPNPERLAGMIEQMSRLASSPWIALVAAGATLANPGGFIPLALKDVSQLGPSTAQYILYWTFFSIVALLPLELALLMLMLAPERALRTLEASQGWIERNARTIAAVIVVALGVTLLRNGISGLS